MGGVLRNALSKLAGYEIPGWLLAVLWGFFAYKVIRSGWIQEAWRGSGKYVRDIVWQEPPASGEGA